MHVQTVNNAFKINFIRHLVLPLLCVHFMCTLEGRWDELVQYFNHIAQTSKIIFKIMI